jgi:hypothetical protein
MVLFYREKRSRDYLAIDSSTNGYYLTNFAQDHFEGRATAIAGQIGSVCTTGISREYLKTQCRRIARKQVPQIWQKAIGF